MRNLPSEVRSFSHPASVPVTRVCPPEHLLPLRFGQDNAALAEQPPERSLSHSALEDTTTVQTLRQR